VINVSERIRKSVQVDLLVAAMDTANSILTYVVTTEATISRAGLKRPLEIYAGRESRRCIKSLGLFFKCETKMKIPLNGIR